MFKKTSLLAGEGFPNHNNPCYFRAILGHGWKMLGSVPGGRGQRKIQEMCKKEEEKKPTLV